MNLHSIQLEMADRSPMIYTLANFHYRVLAEGHMTNPKHRDYSPTNQTTLEELKNKLFFNQVFKSNTDEMFQRYDCSPVIDKFIQAQETYQKNVDMIKLEQERITGITISREPINMDQQLEISKCIGNGSISIPFYPRDYNSWSELERVDPAFRLTDGQIYYFTFSGSKVTINVLPTVHPVYQKRIFDGKTMYKTDYAILEWFKSVNDSFTAGMIRFTLNKKRAVTKVEVYGSDIIWNAIKHLFPNGVPVVTNKYMFTDDIMDLISSYMTEKKKEIQNKRPVNVLDYLDHDDLIEYPVDSFEEYISFLQSVVDCPDTKEISICLYRIGSDPQLYNVLKQASEQGIKVNINIELYASGETINRFWLNQFRKLEGVKVSTYGGKSIKVHCKLTLVEFINGKEIAQIGTGNYHTKTTTQYTDLSLITSDIDVCYQVSGVFDLLMGKFKYEDPLMFNPKLLVTRFNARSELINLIMSQADPDGYICMKCNAIDDDDIIDALNTAASKGCTIDLIVRGVMTWTPKKDMSVTWKSIVWDKLEHSRVYCFGRKNPKVYMGSLDMVTHKLDDRIETLVRITDPDIMLKIVGYLNRYITATNGCIMWG